MDAFAGHWLPHFYRIAISARKRQGKGDRHVFGFILKIKDACPLFSLNELLGVKEDDRSNGMARGRAHETFKAVSQLPRRQQAKILEVVDALLAKQDAE